MTHDDARWWQIDDIFAQALDLPPEQQPAFLDAACAGDEALRREVEALLKARRAAERLLDDDPAGWVSVPLLPGLDAVAGPGPAALPAGQVVGAYRLLRPIGQGGMGAVYLAERADGQFQQYVAVKLIRGGWNRPDDLGRFRLEQQILARLQHPNIARLLDGGVTEAGLPYFVMEYVDGEPIDAYCDHYRLSVEARLELFETVCRAVQYAHQNLVVHRDLKPSNILVTEPAAGEGGGQVKLLDFGIAKLLDEAAAPVTVPLTETGQRVMTPAYAAPEQVKGEAVTTATDVYALGVVLYELMTGRRPYRLPSRVKHEVERIIMEEEPERPSTVVTRAKQVHRADGTTESVAPEAVSRLRGTSAEHLRRRLSGDLDNIVLMALRKEPERRYTSAEALLEDLKRHRTGMPVAARKATLAYRASTFVRRHRFGVATACAFAVFVVGFAVAMTVQQAKTAQERDEKRLEAARANDMLDFVVGMFEQVDPVQAQGRTLTASALVENGLARVADLEDQPLRQASVLDVMGKVCYNLALYSKADSLYRRALEIRRAALGEAHPDVAESMHNLGAALSHQRRFEEAQAYLEQALTVRRAALGAGDPRVLESLNELAFVHYSQGHDEAAAALYQQALTRQRDPAWRRHPEIAESLDGLATVRYDQGLLEDAEALFRQALDIRLAAPELGPTHLYTAHTLYGLANCLLARDDLEGAEAFHRQALQIYRQVLGDRHDLVANSLYALANLLRKKQGYEEAEALYLEAAGLYRTIRGAEDIWTAYPLIGLGGMLVERGEARRAEPFLRQGLDIFRRSLAEQDPRVVDAGGWLGRCLTALGRYGEAEALLVASYRALEDDPRQQHRIPRIARYLVALYEAWSKPDKAEAYRALLDEPLAPGDES